MTDSMEIEDVDRAVGFYTDAFGLEETERVDRYAFLSVVDHHDVAFYGIGADASGPGPGVGLYHAAFELDDRSELRRCYGRPRDRNVEVAPVDHGISKALYFDDPSGDGLEVNVDIRADDERWGGTNEPFDPTAL